jgi:hypothetical protein
MRFCCLHVISSLITAIKVGVYGGKVIRGGKRGASGTVTATTTGTTAAAAVGD